MTPRFAALALLLSGCDTTVDWVVSGEADYGSVYICDTACTKPDGSPGFEWCFDGDADTLSELKGDSCRPITASDRLYPWLVGCAYSCNGSLTGAGANAHCGAYCP